MTRIEKEDQYLVYCNLFRAKSGMMACEIACEPEFTKWRAARLILMMNASRRVISRTATVPLQSPSLPHLGVTTLQSPAIRSQLFASEKVLRGIVKAMWYSTSRCAS